MLVVSGVGSVVEISVAVVREAGRAGWDAILPYISGICGVAATVNAPDGKC